MPDSSLEQIHIYEFDESFNLRNIINAKKGAFEKGEWKLKDIKQTILNNDSVMTKTIAAGSWKSLMRPEMMNALIISPQKMSSINLLKFINYLKKNNQKSTKYEVALWEKLIHPLMPLVMIGRVSHRWIDNKQVPDELLYSSHLFQKIIPKNDKIMVFGDNTPVVFLYYIKLPY